VTEPRTGDFGREAGDPYCVTAADADRLLQGARWRRFVVVGDSLAEGLGDVTDGYESVPWGERVAAALRRQQPELAFVNLGERGLRTGEVRAQQLDAAIAFEPDLAAVVCGGNDLLVEDLQLDQVESELDAIVGGLRSSGADVVTFALQNITLAWPELAPLEPRVRQLNDRVRAVSARHGALLIDMWAHPVCADRDVYSADLMHSSMRGHAVLAAELVRRLGAALAAERENSTT
jgi:lysophospholipase L1-like esterase